MADLQDPTTTDVFRAAGLLENPYTSGPWPAVVESYDASKGTATVCPTPRVGDTKGGKYYSLGPVTVPVAWPRMGEGVDDARLSKGDEVLLIPTTPSLRAWLRVGGPQDGTGVGRSLGESVAIPMGISALRRPTTPPAVDTMRRGRPDGTSTVLVNVSTNPALKSIKVQSPSVVLGADALPKAKVARDGDPVLAGATLTAWGLAIQTFTAGVIPNPWVTGVTPVGTVQATGVGVEST